jgi:hypothetical protein
MSDGEAAVKRHLDYWATPRGYDVIRIRTRFIDFLKMVRLLSAVISPDAAAATQMSLQGFANNREQIIQVRIWLTTNAPGG